MESLYDDVLQVIYSYLSLRDKFALQITNKIFYNYTKKKGFLTNIYWDFYYNKFDMMNLLLTHKSSLISLTLERVEDIPIWIPYFPKTVILKDIDNETEIVEHISKFNTEVIIQNRKKIKYN